MTAAERDPGLAAERTTLAWVRTAALIAVVSAFTLRLEPASLPLMFAPPIVSALAILAITATQHRRYRRNAAGVARERLSPAPGPVLLLAATMICLGIGVAVRLV